MVVDMTTAEMVLGHIDASEPAQLACSLVDIPSATGHDQQPGPGSVCVGV